MITLPVSVISKQSFAPYGDCTSPFCAAEPSEGNHRHQFHRNVITQDLSGFPTMTFSICEVIENPDQLKVLEVHLNTDELIMPLDGDMVIVVGHAREDGVCPVDELEAFRVPCGSLVRMNRGVWHTVPFKCKTDGVLHIMWTCPLGSAAAPGNTRIVSVKKEEINAPRTD